MKFTFLILGGLKRRTTRTVLTMLTATIAFFLLGVMTGVIDAINTLTASLHDDRLRVVSRAGFGEHMPVAHANGIRNLDGVSIVAPALAFPGYYQDPGNAFGGAAVEMSSYLSAFPELVLSGRERTALLETRSGATVGAALARRFNWQIGDEVPLISTYLVNKDGNKTWPVKVVAIHNESNNDSKILANEIYVNIAYVDEYRADESGVAHMFVVGLDGTVPKGNVIASIDALFANSGNETSSFSEKAFFTNRLQQVGDVGAVVRAILASVFFALLIVLGSASIQSVNERKKEFGTLKTIGFSAAGVAGLIFSETAVLIGVSAFAGLLIASISFPFLFGQIAVANMYLSADVWLLGMNVALTLSALVALRPMFLLARLEPAQVHARV